MTVTAALSGGRVISLPQPASLVLRRERDTPADELTVTFSVSETLPALRELTVARDGTCLFCGIVDEQRTRLNSSGLQVVVVCRSLEAILLDNEAPPQRMLNPTAARLEAALLNPFDLCFAPDETFTLPGELTIEKGESGWAVLARCCNRQYGTDPWVDEQGLVHCNPRETRDWKLTDVTAAEYAAFPCYRIGEVWQQSCRGQYDTRWKADDIPTGRPGTVRRRYLSLQQGKNPHTVLQQSAANGTQLSVTCKGAWLLNKNDTAAVTIAGLGSFARCPMRGLVYRLTSSGEQTELTLESTKEECICG